MAQEPAVSPSSLWRNNALQSHLAVDIVAAVTAAAAISPIITATDRSVVESVTTGRPLVRTLAKHLLCPFTQPRIFFATKPVFVVWSLYAATYLTANASETLIEIFLDADKALAGTLVSSAVFAVNTPLSVWKDVRFAQFFGTRVVAAQSSTATTASTSVAAARRRMPASVSAAFLVRDIITVFGSFAIAPQFSAMIPDGLAQSAQAKASAAQLIVPAMTQIVATPVHLLGLDLYNRPGRKGVEERMNGARRKLLSTTVMRAFRLIPAYGFGIIFNGNLRSSLRNKLTS
ncbi:hypothetical protein BKA67DRAFT_672285 [Truncatella angustata]|uniref:Uncharacterized protein n=1 Tax=Truncatella angustata TaxID=152316 RepID=A0A9P8UQS3_9PEZI|nr:uncharacterized protein BKA67DRAFT_672285 [Truncatella angustata]KAH6656514.1 hypothetical protein BKA67DRAFT_672285 [Truncatella angustata]KAH8195153.1 hypothetical protein TruAng_010678 [Truncatella angustata]